MKKKFQKFLSVVLMLTMLFTVPGQIVYAASEEIVASSDGIEMIEHRFTDTSFYVKYYWTLDGETMLYTESGKIIGSNVFLDTISVKVNQNKEPISSTNQVDRIVTPVALYTNSETMIESRSCTYKPYTETFSFKVDKWTLGLVIASLVATIGIATGDAGVIAGVLIDAVADGIIANIPDSVYFDGERCVSHSVGKIYYRYRGNFYSDSSKNLLLAENVSWSRRWGH